MRISHGNKLLYCHSFNNKKKCPYEEIYIFIHEDSEMCKYGSKCEINFCMHKHSNEKTDIIEIDKNVTFQNPCLQKNLNVIIMILTQQIKKN